MMTTQARYSHHNKRKMKSPKISTKIAASLHRRVQTVVAEKITAKSHQISPLGQETLHQVVPLNPGVYLTKFWGNPMKDYHPIQGGGVGVVMSKICFILQKGNRSEAQAR